MGLGTLRGKIWVAALTALYSLVYFSFSETETEFRFAASLVFLAILGALLLVSRRLGPGRTQALITIHLAASAIALLWPAYQFGWLPWLFGVSAVVIAAQICFALALAADDDEV